MCFQFCVIGARCHGSVVANRQVEEDRWILDLCVGFSTATKEAVQISSFVNEIP